MLPASLLLLKKTLEWSENSQNIWRWVFVWPIINISRSNIFQKMLLLGKYIQNRQALFGWSECEWVKVCTVQAFISCTSRPDVFQCLVVQTPMENMSKIRQAQQRPTYIANQSCVQLWGHPCIHAQETGWQSGARSCIMPGLPTHLVQELNVGTVYAAPTCCCVTGDASQKCKELLLEWSTTALASVIIYITQFRAAMAPSCLSNSQLLIKWFYNPSISEVTFVQSKRWQLSWKPSKICHIGIHWKALAEHSQMSTQVPRLQSYFFLFFLRHSVFATFAICSIRVKHLDG